MKPADAHALARLRAGRSSVSPLGRACGLAPRRMTSVAGTSAWRKSSSTRSVSSRDDLLQRIVRQLELGRPRQGRRTRARRDPHRLEQGMAAGLAREARLFAEAIVDPDGGKTGIRQFLDKISPPLPVRRDGVWIVEEPRTRGRKRSKRTASLLPVGAPFYPGVTRDPGVAICLRHRARPRDRRAPLRPARHARARADRPGRRARPQRRAALHADQRGQLQRYLGARPASPSRRSTATRRISRSPARAASRLIAALGSEARAEGRAEGRRPGGGLFGHQRSARPQVGRRSDVRRFRDPGL